ncbi:hypothetical protein [Chengkuizengella axinellae]|uniref:Uncharacterized protein n=1 Tax=Chengkuizengella axinellae TaxID=3064388 RepID=A0ABT9IWR9_9BACL|nr:hypothetical protein [Chengkuizengella sp. 2205SS18-9]MDP5273803.1 hypothetical protein [Chengkuizengella sp. 2205SS18-9]
MSFHNNKVEIEQFKFETPENSRNTGEVISMDDQEPTQVAEIIYDCLEPGNLIWLNSIFHIDTTEEVTVNYKILKNKDEIYSSITELDSDDEIGQIFSQQTVDMITKLEKDVTYKVVCDTNTPMVNLSGPINFTDTRFVEDKKFF